MTMIFDERESATRGRVILRLKFVKVELMENQR